MSHRDRRNTNQRPYNPSPQVKFNGLINQGSTCYLSSVLQVLFMTEDFRDAVERHAHDNPETEFIDHQLNDLFDALKRHTAQTNKITDKLKISRVYEQRDAAEYFEKILKQTSSEASQVFHGTLTHRTICSNCEKPSDSDGKFWHLPLTLNSDGEYSVEDGISEYFRDTHFSGDMKMYCDNCDDKYDATIKCVLKHPPEVLMLLLKRFELNVYTLTYFKNKRTVRVPCRLQISENQVYDLYALVEHSGELGSGHYSASIKSDEDDKWFNFNDTTVTSLNFQPFQSDNFERSDGAYLLFYRKQSDKPADACTRQDTGGMSTPEECPSSFDDIYGQPHNPENPEILRKKGDMAGGNRTVGAISFDQDDGTGLKDDEDSASPRAKRPSSEPCFNEENHVNVKRNHWHLQLQDKQSDQRGLVPNEEEAERGTKRKKRNSSFKAGKDKDEGQTSEIKRAEPISTSQFDQNSSQEVRKTHKYPQNEGKTRENERTGAERDLKVDPEEQTEIKKEGQHYDEERFSFVNQDITGDMWSGQQVGPDYDTKSCRKARQDGGNMSSRHDPEGQMGTDVTKPNSGKILGLVYDRMQNNERTFKWVQGRDHRYDRDVRHKEEMNVDMWAEENRRDDDDHVAHMSARYPEQDVVVVSEKQRKKQFDEKFQSRDDSFLRGEGLVERRGATETRKAKQMRARHHSEGQLGARVVKLNSGKLLTRYNMGDDRMQDNQMTGKRMQESDHRYDRDVNHEREMNVGRWAEENRRRQYDHDAHLSDRDHRQNVVVSETQRKKEVNENFQSRDDSFLRGEGLVKRRETTETRGEVRAESNVEKVGEKHPSTNSREIKKRTYDEIEESGNSDRSLMREESLQVTSNSKENSLAEDDKNRKEGFGGRLKKMIRPKIGNDQGLLKGIRNLNLNKSGKKQRSQRTIEEVQDEDERRPAKKPRNERSCKFPWCVPSSSQISESD